MSRLLRYFKPYLAVLAAVVALLAVQALTELALPDYTADIVDVGIQQGGIESVVPQLLPEEALGLAPLLLDEAQQALLSAGYTSSADLADAGALALAQRASAALPEGLLYLRADADTASLEAPMTTLMAAYSLAGQAMAAVGALPEAQPSPDTLAQAQAYLASLDDSIRQQSATAGVKALYQALNLDVSGIQTGYMLRTGGKMLGLALLSALCAVAVGFLGSRVSASMGRDLRGRVFRNVTAFSATDMERFSTASLITRTTNDVQQVQQMLVMLVRIVFYAPIIGIGGIIRALDANRGMAWIIALGVALLLAVVAALYLATMPRFRKLQTLLDRVNLVTRELLTGLPVIRAFSTQKKEEERFDGASRALTKTQLFVGRVMGGMMPLMSLIMNAIAVLILWAGAHGVESGGMQVGAIMAFIQYTMQIIMAFLMIAMVSVMLPRASVAMQRIDEVITLKPSLASPEHSQPLDDARRGEVAFRDVSFRYPGAEEDALRHLTFTAKPGTTTAILGGTGCGKSTLTMLIPRLADVTGGSITVDGVDVRQADLHDLRRRIGYVPQKSVLFSGTIGENIAYSDPDMPQDQVERAARIAQAADFIGQKPSGYNDSISQGGDNVSGGQKQRLAIARAVARQPEIYVLDDSFSALDFRTDKTLRQALHDETGGATVILVAQRIATVMNADQILVMEDGEIVGQGTHRELLATCESYRQIAEGQLSGEELAHAE